MAGTDELLRSLLRLIRGVCGSQSASLYISELSSSSAKPILLHDGEPPTIPELADLESAARFINHVQSVGKHEDSLSESMLLDIVESRETGFYLLRIPDLESLLASNSSPAPERREGEPRLTAVEAWLGLRMDCSPADLKIDDLPPGLPDSWWSMVLAITSALAWHARCSSAQINDLVSDLPGRSEFQLFLDQLVQRTGDSGCPGLIFVNPDGFDVVNQRFGRDEGDAAIREIGERLRATARSSDFAFRYGAAVFGLLMPSASLESLRTVADKLHAALTAEPFLQGSVPLDFSLGAALHEQVADATVEDHSAQLIRRADRALNAAKLGGGGRLVAWTPELSSADVSQFDQLNGIYTANPARDYRNMLLLWETVGIVASHDDVDTLVAKVLEKLAGSFGNATLGFFWCARGGGRGHGMLLRSEQSDHVERVADPAFDRERSSLFDEALREKRTVTAALPSDGATLRACVMPLAAGEQPLGFFYLEWHEDRLDVGPADLDFLSALAKQLTIALDRARLVELEKLRQEQEKKLLLDELSELQKALQHSQLVCRSPSMESVLESARRVAPTDMTVLLNGESGTGKELLARTLHQLSARRDKPLVVVDCAAIATTLIDSELFGHERGAYTGAERRTTGRLLEADGGTILLDEIGELPLEVQSKMLRFVQEKQFTPVGSSQPQTVDVRVIAVTNRDLVSEVAAGRFREDLYHRLNVVQLVVPPLRERPEDILPLAKHFLEQFSIQYRKRVHRLSEEAEACLMAYAWPGNVRELQNRMMRAVVLCEGDEIEPAEVRLETSDPELMDRPEMAPPESAPAGTLAEGGPDEVRLALCAQIDAAMRKGAFPPPIGKWVGEDLILEAYHLSGDTASQAAALLAIPETTFRRKLNKALARTGSGLSPRPDGWAPLRAAISALMRTGNPAGADLLEQVRLILLEEVAAKLPRDVKRASALMGVSEPTYQRWAKEVTTHV